MARGPVANANTIWAARRLFQRFLCIITFHSGRSEEYGETTISGFTLLYSEGSVDLVVTSPPFLDVVQYAADNWLRCWFAGIDPSTIAMDTHRTEEAWTRMVHNVLHEQARIVRPGGYVAFEVGEVRGGRVLLERLVWQAAESLPFHRIGVMINDQRFTKTANCWGVVNGTKGTNTNRIVLLQRLSSQYRPITVASA